MKKVMIVCLLVTLFFISACADSKKIDGKVYEPVGLVHVLIQSDKYSPIIEYKPVWGNIIWGTIGIETIIAPIYFFGFAMLEPSRLKLIDD